MLKIKLINEQATLNNFHYVETKEYIPNFPFSIKFQIQDSETLMRLIPSVDAVAQVIFQLRDGTELTKTATLLFTPDDRSIFKVDLSKTESNNIVGGNFQVLLDFNGSASAPPDLSDSTDLRSGMAYNVLAKIQFDGEC
jgi:hypothetical protein